MQIKDIGTVKVGHKITVVFDIPKNIDIIQDKGKDKIIKSCGCFSYTIDKKNGKLSIGYKPKTIPKHLVEQGYYFTTKSIIIYHKENGRQVEFISKFHAKITQ